MAEVPISSGSNPSSNSSSSIGSRNNNNPNYHQLNLAGELLSLLSTASLIHVLKSMIVTVSRASLDSAYFLKKPSAYVEVIIDGKLIRKTEAVKSNHEPVWCNETFTV